MTDETPHLFVEEYEKLKKGKENLEKELDEWREEKLSLETKIKQSTSNLGYLKDILGCHYIRIYAKKETEQIDTCNERISDLIKSIARNKKRINALNIRIKELGDSKQIQEHKKYSFANLCYRYLGIYIMIKELDKDYEGNVAELKKRFLKKVPLIWKSL